MIALKFAARLPTKRSSRLGVDVMLFKTGSLSLTNPFRHRKGLARLAQTLAFCLPGAFATSHVGATSYEARLDVAAWNLEPSPLECKLWQAVPNYGEAVFSVRAGERLQFYLKTLQPVYKSGKARLAVSAPAWHDGVSTRSVGATDVVPGIKPVIVGESIAQRFLAELQAGMFPSITMPGWYAPHDIQIDVSAVNFGTAYQGYLSCLTSLFPANFEQLQASMLHFRTDLWKIEGTTQQRLDLLAGYIALDPSVAKIIIDGHTDTVGRRGHNWELSRLRANATREYLISKGVPADKILMRYWGETKNVVKKGNNRNVAVNRRVLVQMVKG